MARLLQTVVLPAGMGGLTPANTLLNLHYDILLIHMYYPAVYGSACDMRMQHALALPHRDACRPRGDMDTALIV